MEGTTEAISSMESRARELFRGTVDENTVSTPLTAAGLQASRLAACDDGTFLLATGANVYRIHCTPTRKRLRLDNHHERPGTNTEEQNNGVNVVTSAIADDYIIPRPFSDLRVDRDALHSTHETEVQSITAVDERVASVDAYGRCVVTVGSHSEHTSTNGRRSFVLPAASQCVGDAGWTGVSMRANDTARVAVVRQMFRDLTIFDIDAAMRRLYTLQTPHAVTFCGSRDIVAVTEGGDIALYDVRANETRGLTNRKQLGPGALLAIDASDDGETIVTAGADRVVHLFDTRACAIRDRWPACLKYETAAVLLSRDMFGMAYVCGVDNEVACGAVSDLAASKLRQVDLEQSAMMSGAITRSPRRAFGFRADVRVTGIACRYDSGEEIGAVTESGAFYLLRPSRE